MRIKQQATGAVGVVVVHGVFLFVVDIIMSKHRFR